jgi:hypothetical protein
VTAYEALAAGAVVLKNADATVVASQFSQCGFEPADSAAYRNIDLWNSVTEGPQVGGLLAYFGETDRMASPMTVIVESSAFVDCAGGGAGGMMLSHHANSSTDLTLILENVLFRDNNAIRGGGHFVSVQVCVVYLSVVVVARNEQWKRCAVDEMVDVVIRWLCLCVSSPLLFLMLLALPTSFRLLMFTGHRIWRWLWLPHTTLRRSPATPPCEYCPPGLHRV